MRHACSHSEYAEAGFWNGLPQLDAQSQRQAHARVDRVDDTIVPEPRGGVIGIALRLVLLANRRLERRFFVAAPRSTLAFDDVAPHGGQHVGSLLAAHDADARVRPGP